VARAEKIDAPLLRRLLVVWSEFVTGLR